MPRYAYVNGRYLRHDAATVHIEDRGYQFADGVYEVVPVVGGAPIDEEPHLDRLGRSLGELSIPWPMPRQAMQLVTTELLRRNRMKFGLLYIQVTRGVAPRDHAFPPASVKPALVMTTMRRPVPKRAQATQGITITTTPDIRWKRCDIKTISLLPNVLAKQKAITEGSAEAWMVDDKGFVTEGSSTNSWIVTRDGALVTHPATTAILSGITRLVVIDLAKKRGLRLEERAFSLEEALAAREAFITSSSNYVMPVTAIDGRPIGNGGPGTLSGELRDAYLDLSAATAAPQ